MKKLFSVLQKIGKSLMLPVSVLPAAGLLMRFGQPDLLNIPYMAQAGDVIFSNLPMIFAVGVAIGFSGGEGVAALAAVVGQLILEGITKAANASSSYPISMGVFGGISIGLIAGIIYNRFNNIKLPQVLGFFGGKRFVPISTSAAALIFSVIGVNIWETIQGWINIFAQFASSSILGPAFYAAGKRLLIPVGLHHIYYPPFLYQFGEYVYNGITYYGDAPRFFHGDITAGIFMASEFPVLMFGLPGAAAAMIAASRKENRKKVSGILISAAFVAFLTGITEPIEFSFIFVAPMLFVFHVAAAFLSGIITSILEIRLGYTFSASFIDYLLGFKFAAHPLLLWVIGLGFFLLYFSVFYFSIRTFNIRTPGREEEDFVTLKSSNLKDAERAAMVLEAVGGADNILMLDACITRLRLTLRDSSNLDEGILKALGAAGIMTAGNNVQAIFGTDAERIKDDIETIVSRGGYIKDFNEDLSDNKSNKSLVKNINPDHKNLSILFSPIEGEIIDLDKVPDEAFAGRFLGDGFAIIPYDNKVYAPADGEVSVLFPTKHAIVILTNEGLEVLIHVGIDTILLNGEGFAAHVAQGDKVKKGDLLVTFDENLVRKKSKSLISPIIITNMNQVESISISLGKKKILEETAVVKIIS